MPPSPLPRWFARYAALALTLAAGCHRAPPGAQASPGFLAPRASLASPAPAVSTGPGQRPAATTSSAAAAGVVTEPLDDPFDDAALVPASYGEAWRTSAEHPGYREVLSSQRDLIERRFPGTPLAELSLQVVALPQGRRAVLVATGMPGPRPLLFVFDEQRSLVWMKERPLGGLDASITQLALCAGPSGEILLSWYDPPTRLIAARKWDSGGGLLIDFQVLAAEGADSLSALYWPGHGWVIAASDNGQARAQLLGENGQLLWGSEGRMLVTGGRPAAPLSLLLDTDASVLIAWQGTAPATDGRAAAFHHLATRIDMLGIPVFRQPLDLGEAPLAGEGALPRAGLTRVENGLTRADLSKGPLARPDRYAVDITADGLVRLR